MNMPQSKGSLEILLSTVESEILHKWPLKLRVRIYQRNAFHLRVVCNEQSVVGPVYSCCTRITATHSLSKVF